jgi:hypothetical protein
MAHEAWRTEADEDWLSRHRSGFMRRLRHRFRSFGDIGSAVSNAETGPFAGAPRNPQLKVDDGNKAYAVVRYTTERIAYTTMTSAPDECSRCGGTLVEEHEIDYIREDSTRVAVGTVRTCRRCQSDSWMLHSRMPSVARARKAYSKVVL